MKITQFTQQNLRNYQEDRAFVKQLCNGEALLGMFDGHGGDWTSEFAAKHTPYIFKSIHKNLKATPELALQYLFQRLADKTQFYYAGSTACVVWVKKDIAYVATLGDSLAIIKTANDDIWISPEHNVRTNTVEVDKAVSRGGVVSDGYLFDSTVFQGSGLQMSRALGDSNLSRVLNREPEIFSIPINEKSWILICTDGLIDPTHASTACLDVMVDMIKNSKVTAENLVEMGATFQRDDNSTAILARIE